MDFNELLRLPEATSGSLFADMEGLFGDRYPWYAVVVVVLLLLNAVSFVLYGLDKWKARHKKWRIPESVLLLSAALFGALGAYAAMHLFRHKTKHTRFVVGVPLMLSLQIVLLCLAFYFAG